MAKAQPSNDSTDADLETDTGATPDRPNAATRAIAYSESECCGAGTELKELDRAKQQFDIKLRRRLDQIGYDGSEVVACCMKCKNAVGLVCE